MRPSRAATPRGRSPLVRLEPRFIAVSAQCGAFGLGTDRGDAENASLGSSAEADGCGRSCRSRVDDAVSRQIADAGICGRGDRDSDPGAAGHRTNRQPQRRSPGRSGWQFDAILADAELQDCRASPVDPHDRPTLDDVLEKQRLQYTWVFPH
jgi:hypothetical protein